MKKATFFLFVCLLFSIPIISQNTFTNSDCIKLAKAGLSEDLIISTINSSESYNFDTSIDAIIKLKEAGVSEKVIQTMMTKQQMSKKNIGSFTFDFNGTSYQLPNSGIFFFKNGKFIELNSTSITSSSPRSGLVNVKMINELEGNKANYSIDRPGVFIFAFDDMDKSLNDSNANAISNQTSNQLDYMAQMQAVMAGGSNNQNAVSPNEFKLIKLDVSKNRRQFTGGRVSMFGQRDTSLKDKNIGQFKYEALSNNIFLVTLYSSNKSGEYCFMYSGNLQQSSGFGAMFANKNNNKVFDFTLR
tara:strand:- start:1090 stop:1992 length:903 start_codon:yes stop_codon:yes gene_type:complete